MSLFAAYLQQDAPVGVGFLMQAVKQGHDGLLVRLEGPTARFSTSSYLLFDLLSKIERRKRRPLASMFPWYVEDFDFDASQRPRVTDCHRPKEVLASVQAIEHELQTHSAKYPSQWAFLRPEADGALSKHTTLQVYYRGKPCRLFGDEQGCWAVETDTPLTYPVHYELAELPHVVVRLSVDGPELTVRIERTSCLSAHTKVLAGMKAVCLFAMERGALLLTSKG